MESGRGAGGFVGFRSAGFQVSLVRRLAFGITFV
jgi:hypothetical protein